MVTWEVSNLRAMSMTSTRPSRSRISIIARRRSSLSTLPRSLHQGKQSPAACDCAFFLYRLLSFVQSNVLRSRFHGVVRAEQTVWWGRRGPRNEANTVQKNGEVKSDQERACGP